jgi:hypothetical protein
LSFRNGQVLRNFGSFGSDRYLFRIPDVAIDI